MNLQTLFSATLIAAVFVAWPIVGRWTGAPAAWVNTMVGVGTLTGISILSGRNLTERPVVVVIAILLFAGTANGVAVHFYGINATDPAASGAGFIVLVSVMMAVMAPILDWLFNGNVPSADRLLGYGLAAGAIYILGR